MRNLQARRRNGEVQGRGKLGHGLGQGRGTGYRDRKNKGEERMLLLQEYGTFAAGVPTVPKGPPLTHTQQLSR